MGMAGAPEGPSWDRSIDRRHGTAYVIFNTCLMAIVIFAATGCKALLAGAHDGHAGGDPHSSAINDPPSMAANPSGRCIMCPLARKHIRRPVLCLAIACVDARLLALSASAAILGGHDDRACFRAENFSHSLFAIFPSEERLEGLCRRRGGKRSRGSRIHRGVRLGAEPHLYCASTTMGAPRRGDGSLQPSVIFDFFAVASAVHL